MKKLNFAVLLAMFAFMGGGKSYAHDIAVANADGVTIYYNFTNNQTELEVTYQGNNQWIADYAGKVVIPESVTYEGNTYPVTSIGWYTFCFCSDLTEVTIPNSVTSIGEMTFLDCTSLTELTIPSSVTYLDNSAFRNCSGFEKITVEDGNPNYDSRENCNAIINTTTNELIAGCNNTIIPGSVTSIGGYAFYNCSGLTGELIISENVTYIGYSAFYGCSGLTKVTIGTNVRLISSDVFQGCTSLTTIYSLRTAPPDTSGSAFDSSHYTNADVFVPEEALEAYKNDIAWKNFQKLQGFNVTGVAKAKAAAEQIQSANGQVTVTGLADGTTVTVYDLSGKQVGTATSKGGQATVNTGMTAGSAAIVKVGEKSVKTVMK